MLRPAVRQADLHLNTKDLTGPSINGTATHTTTYGSRTLTDYIDPDPYARPRHLQAPSPRLGDPS
jgi:hypothetical protein